MVVVNRLSLASRLAGAASLAILAAAATPVVIMAGTDLGIGASIGLTGLAVIAGTGAVMLGFRAMLGPLDGVGRDLDIVARELATRDTFSRAQNSLDRNLGLLREALAAYGQPRRVGDQLFFGDTCSSASRRPISSICPKASRPTALTASQPNWPNPRPCSGEQPNPRRRSNATPSACVRNRKTRGGVRTWPFNATRWFRPR